MQVRRTFLGLNDIIFMRKTPSLTRRDILDRGFTNLYPVIQASPLDS